MPTSDPFLHERYQQLHDGPMQAKFRRIKPWPVGCVLIQHPDWDLETIRTHFRCMRELGFTALKQCQVCSGTDKRTVMHMALDEGIIPWWYGEGGWEDPTPELLTGLGIAPDIATEALWEHPVWRDRQTRLLHARVDREADRLAAGRSVRHDDAQPDRKRGSAWVPSVQPTFNFEIDEEQKPLFLDWLKRQYGDIETLNLAWNTHHCMLPGSLRGTNDGDGGAKPGWSSWEHLAAELPGVVNSNFREYRRTRDVFRYKADNYINWLRDRMDDQLADDPVAPLRAGGEMGLFLPFASRGTDMEGIAELMRNRGSFYPSFHPAWHFEEVEFEGARPMYMQASLTTDWFKGGWNATWESTGGPQQMTGHKAPFVPAVRDMKPGFTVDEGIMRQLMLSWIAAGYRGFGLWCWSMRTAGWEAGEFNLLDRNYRPTGRARAAGAIGQTCRRLRAELWDARKEPCVGVFQDWDMEAFWAAASRGGRDFFKSEPIRARIGAARALINANIPWEHVTGSDLRNGLADRYRAIILPACLAIDPDLLTLLRGYVERGGRVVFDAPGGWYDYFGRVLRSDDGSPFERLFGCRLADMQYSRDTSRPWRIDGRSMDGTILDLQPTTATIVEPFDHSTPDEPRPAVTSNRIGAGEAIVIAYEATRACWRPGNGETETTIARLAMGTHPPPYACDGAIVYRLAAPAADHYFLINDGEAAAVVLRTRARYRAAEDPVSGEPLTIDAPIALPAYSARWIRMIK